MLTLVFAIPGRTRWKVQGLHRNPLLAAALERRLRARRGVLQATASPLTGRVLLLLDRQSSTELAHDLLTAAVTAAVQELRRLRHCSSLSGNGAANPVLSPRQAHLLELSPEESSVSRQARRKANLDLAISLVSLSLATLGALLWPPLSVLSVLGFLYVTFPVYTDAVQALGRGQVNVNTLVTITAIGGILTGQIWILSWASVIYPVSRRMLLLIADRSRGALIDVFHGRPPLVFVLVNGVEVELPFSALAAGDLVVARAGELIPVDGVVVDGCATVDQQVLTGEARPMERGVGSQVLAMSSVLTGRIVVEVEQTGVATMVGKIGQILNDTADFKSTAMIRAETLTERTVLPTLLAGGISLPVLGPQSALGIVNAHFRHKVSVVAPIATLSYLNRASRHGIFIKDGRTLDLLDEIDTVVFDKTGTLTDEQPHVGAVYRCDGYSEDEILRLAAAAEQCQEHPLARAITNESRRRSLVVPPIDQDAEHAVGFGLRAVTNGTEVCVGSLRFMEELATITVSASVRQRWEDTSSNGSSQVMVAINGRLAGLIELLPSLRPEAGQVIKVLRRRPKIRSIYIISGDQEVPTRKVAQAIGADHYFAQTQPQDKAGIIEQLQAEGRRVCYVGDGINDAIALRRSQVSISLRGASSVATVAAQIVLMDGSLHRLDYLFDLSRSFTRTMNRTFAAVVAPSFAGMCGALFFRFGLVQTVLLSELSLAGGALSALAPVLDGKDLAPAPLPGAAASDQLVAA